MRKLHFPLLLSALFVLASCGGEGLDAQLFTFKANGKKVDLSQTVVSAFASSGTIHNALVTGFRGTENANVQIFSNRELVDSVYTQAGIPGQVPFGGLMGYFDKKDRFYTSALNRIVIEVTELDDEYIAGTFSGLIRSDNGDELEITEGEFRAKRQN